VKPRFFLNRCIYCCCHCLWTVDSSRLTPVTLQGASRPSALAWSCIIAPSCSKASIFSDQATTGFSDSLACCWPFWDYPDSDCVKQSNTSLSIPLENPD
jgi:hypothetical protein